MPKINPARGNCLAAINISRKLITGMAPTKVPSPPSIDAWAPRSLSEIAQRLSDLDGGWCVAGGWALDVWRGRQTRVHEDIEDCCLAMRLAGCRIQTDLLSTFGGGLEGATRRTPERGRIAHEYRPSLAGGRSGNVWRLEVLLEPGDSETWVFRRNHDVRRARPRMVSVSAKGVPYLKPERVFLYKAKAQRSKDDADFRENVGLMTREAREWLREALLRVHPGHPWIEALR
jgi:hypothetical protein